MRSAFGFISARGVYVFILVREYSIYTEKVGIKAMNKCPACIYQENSECHLNPPIEWDELANPRRGWYTKVSRFDWCSRFVAHPEVIEVLQDVKPRGRPKGS